jgi:hypothetical protein
MEQTITFHIGTEDKKFIEDEADKVRLTTSALCRYIILKNLKQEESKAIA